MLKIYLRYHNEWTVISYVVTPYLSKEIADSATILEDMVKDSANITDCSGKYSGLKQKVRISIRPEELAVIFI